MYFGHDFYITWDTLVSYDSESPVLYVNPDLQ